MGVNPSTGAEQLKAQEKQPLDEVVEDEGRRWHIPVLPNKQPLGDGTKFWEQENARLLEIAKQSGDLDNLYHNYYWQLAAGWATRRFTDVSAGGQDFSGHAKVVFGGSDTEPMYTAILDTNLPTTPEIRDQLARALIPETFFN